MGEGQGAGFHTEGEYTWISPGLSFPLPHHALLMSRAAIKININFVSPLYTLLAQSVELYNTRRNSHLKVVRTHCEVIRSLLEVSCNLISQQDATFE